MGAVAERISRKLHEGLAPDFVEVRDESARHAGHMGARPEGATHVDVRVISAAFEGLSRVERQRVVNALLRDELAGPVHALSLKLLTPGET
jgi:BolA protein